MYTVHVFFDSKCDIWYTVHLLSGVDQQIIDNFFVEVSDQMMAQ